MSTTAVSTKHLRTLWRGEKPWHWVGLYIGHVQPIGYRNHVKNRGFPMRFWQIHITPVHIERDGAKWEIGFCFGKRTIFVKVHR